MSDYESTHKAWCEKHGVPYHPMDPVDPSAPERPETLAEFDQRMADQQARDRRVLKDIGTRVQKRLARRRQIMRPAPSWSDIVK